MAIEIPKKEPLNIVPFIDIMLVLLAMVLSISTFVAKGEIELALPKAKNSSTASEHAEAIFVQVKADGTIYFKDDPVTIELLEAKLSTIDAQTRVVLRIDREAKFDRFVQVIDLLKAKHHENFSIATEKDGR